MIFGRRINPLSKSVIAGPDIPKSTHLGKPGKDPTVFPVAKYIFISKTSESFKTYKIKGIPRCTRVYGVGVLTDKNNYYFSELHTRHCELTYSNRDLFQRVLTTKYILTPKTRVVITENITEKDPLYAFISIVGSAIGYHIKKTNLYHMLRRLNNRIHLVKNGKNKDFSTKKWHAKRILNKLIERDRFDFITDPNWQEQISTKTENVRKAYLECAVGMLYMLDKDISLKYLAATKENRRKRQLEKLKEESNNPKKDV